MWVADKTVILLTRAIPERIRGGLRRCAIQIDVYFTVTLNVPNLLPSSNVKSKALTRAMKSPAESVTFLIYQLIS